MVVQVRAVAATGALGTGFREETLRAAVAQQPDMLGCDAGSTDVGPFYLGSGRTMASPAAVRRDLMVMLREAVPAGVPVLVGSAGTGGGRPHLAGAAEMARSIASELGVRFRMAVIEAEQDPALLAAEFDAGRITPLSNAPDLTADDLRSAHRIVAQMGAEPFAHALEQGAEVVLAGRASDAAISSAVPMMKGAGADPFLLTEPSGVLDTTACRYDAVDARTVRVSGSTFHPKDPYDVRLEGVRLAGHRYVVPAGIRDPLVLRQLDRFIEESLGVVRSKVAQSLGLAEDAYRLTARVYGRDACLGDLEPERDHVGHEVGLLLEVTAIDATAAAQAVASVAWHTVLHHPIPEWNGLISNLAFPYSPPELDVGPAFEFMMHHVWQLEDPLTPFPMRMEDVG